MLQSKARILIVHEDEMNAAILSRILTKLGYEIVDVVTSGTRAIFKTETEKPDLILLDFNLNDRIDSLQMMNLIDQNYGIPILLMNTLSDEQSIAHIIARNKVNYLIRPFDHLELFNKIESILNNSRSFNRIQKLENALYE